MLPWTGERFIPGMQGVIEAEHLHRYLLAREHAHQLDVLDVASGEGYGSYMLSAVAKTVTGVDIALEAVQQAQDKYQVPNLKFIQADCARLPLPAASFDLVVSFETLEHHAQHQEMMTEIARVLRPGGVLIMSSPNRPEYAKTLPSPNHYHVKELDYDEFLTLLKQHFSQAKIYAQKVASGSLMVPEATLAEPYHHYQSLSKTEEWLGGAVYFVAIAGNAALPALGTSFYEVERCANQAPSVNKLDLQLYYQLFDDSGAGSYSETNSVRTQVAVNGVTQTVMVALPKVACGFGRFRLDLANQPVAVKVVSVSICNADGLEVERVTDFSSLGRQHHGQHVFEYQGDCWVLCMEEDPRCELNFSHVSLAKITSGGHLHLELQYHPLMEILPVFIQSIELPSSTLPMIDMQPLLSSQDWQAFSSWIRNVKQQLLLRNQMIQAQRLAIANLKAEQLSLQAQLSLIQSSIKPE